MQSLSPAVASLLGDGFARRAFTPRRAFLYCAATVVLAACDPAGPTHSPNWPAGWQSYVTHAGVTTYVVPVTLADGTRCIVVSGNAAYSGRGISCDWSK